MRKHFLFETSVILFFFCYCNVPDNREKKGDNFASAPDTTLVSNRDTIVFSSFKEIDNYYTPQFDSILSERRGLIAIKNSNSQNQYYVQQKEHLDSSLFAIQWKKINLLLTT